MNKKENERVNILKPLAFIFKLAVKNKNDIILIVFFNVIVNFVLNLSELFIAPMILQNLEMGASFSLVMQTIIVFTLVIMLCYGLKVYLIEFSLISKIMLRMNMIRLLNTKVSVCSYPLTEDEKAIAKGERAAQALMSNQGPGEWIWEVLIDLLTSVCVLIVYVFMLKDINVLIILSIAITCLLSFFIGKRINEWGYRNRREKEQYVNKFSYALKISEDESIAKDMRIFGMKNWINDMYYSAVNAIISFSAKEERKYLISDIIDLIFAFSRNGIAYFYLISLVINGELIASEFLLYFSMTGALSTALNIVFVKLSDLHKVCAELSVILEYLNIKELFKFEEGKSVQPKENESYTIKLDNVSFKYPNSDKYIIKNLNLELNPYEKLAVVGLNGAGKTTLVKLICGFYDPTEGQVLLNGEDIREFNRSDYYKFFSAVFQEFSVLDVTVGENVSQTENDIDFEKIKDCIEKAGLTNKINSLEKGYDTIIGRNVFEDGIELSGGETQRLMLARALYKNAPILILDEPTAALDPIAESDIYNKYNDISKNKLSVFISHRLASTRFCDRIIFLESGSILEEGTHNQLINLNGKYAQLYDVQSRYYKEGVEF